MSELLNKFNTLAPEQRKAALANLTDEELQYLNSQIQEPKFEQERIEEVSFMDRLVAKNLAQDKVAQVNYLQKEYPELEFRHRSDKDSQVFARKRGTSGSYKALDPDSFELEDISDIATDIGSGLAEGAATVAGAVAGAPAGPAGMVGGGMAASGATGAALEGLRQYAGKLAGVPQEVSGSDIALSGALSAAMAPFGGMGSGVIKKAAQKGITNLPKSKFAQEFIEKGVLGQGFGAGKRAMGKVAQELTGVDSKVWKNLVENPKTLQAIDEVGPEQYANSQLTNLEDLVVRKNKEVGQRIGDELRQSGKQIDISQSKQRISGLIQELKSKKVVNDKDKQLISELSTVYDKAFKVDVKVPAIDDAGNFLMNADGSIQMTKIRQELPDFVDAEDAFGSKEILNDWSENFKDLTDSKVSAYTKTVAKKAQGSRDEISKAINNQIEGAPELNREYRQTLKDQDFLRENLRDAKKVSGDMAQDLDGNGQAFLYKGYQKLRKLAGQGGEKQKQLAEMDARYGTNVAETGTDIASYEVNKNAGFTPQSLQGVTSTSRSNLTRGLGIAGGLYAAKQADVDSSLGYGVGGALGMLGGSPAAFKAYMKAAQMGYKATPSGNMIRPVSRAMGLDEEVRKSNGN